MSITVLFFGATADITGTRRQSVDILDSVPARKVFDSVLAGYPQLENHKLHFSINQRFATGDEIVHDGDELAIFTAVSGG